MRWTGVKMKRLIAVILLTLTTLIIGAQAQTTTKKQKPAVQKKIVAPLAVNDAFAKAALHVLIAMRNATLLRGESEHIAMLFEDMEIEASTPTEKQLTSYFHSRNTLHNANLDELVTDAAIRHPMEDSVHESGVYGDWACFNAYMVLLKVNDNKTDFSSVPPACSLENPAKDSYDQIEVCFKAGPKAGESGVPTQATLDKCHSEYLSRNKELKEHGWVKVTP